MTHAKQFFSDDADLSGYVEKELDAALEGLPVFWRKAEGLTLKRDMKGKGQWKWARDSRRPLAWEISTSTAAGRGAIVEHVDLYYELWVSRDVEALVLTHTNVRAGLPNSHWLVRNAKLIPFAALTNEGEGSPLSQPLALRQVVIDTIWKCQPSFDWST